MLFYIAQIFGFLCLASYVISAQTNKRKRVIEFRTISNIFSGIQYILLGSPAGLAVELVGTLRNFIISRYKNRSLPGYLIFVFIMLEVLIGVIFYDGLPSILVVLSGALTTFFISRKNLTSLRFHQISIIIPISIIYNFLVGAWAGIATNVVQLVSQIVGMHKFDHKKVHRLAEKERRHLRHVHREHQKSFKEYRKSLKTRQKRSKFAKTQNPSSKKH